MANNNSPKFPVTYPINIYGVLVNNRQEARAVCQQRWEQWKAACAAEETRRTEAEIARLMRQSYTRSEAQFLATGGVPCRSVSAFV